MRLAVLSDLHGNLPAQTRIISTGRQEFDRDCKWAAAQLDNLRYQHEVQEIWYDAALPGYVLAGVRGDTGEGFQYSCRKLVIGIGGVPQGIGQS